MMEHIKIAYSNKNMMKTLGPSSKRWDAQYANDCQHIEEL